MVLRARQLEIEKAVVELIEDYGFLNYPTSIGTILETLGASLIPYSVLYEHEKRLADLASSDRAFSVISHDYVRTQVVCDDTRGAHFYRARFSGGHELGHIWLEHGEDTPNQEAEANYFSGYLLAPHPLIVQMENPSVSEVRECFGVSRDCASRAITQANARKREDQPWRPHEEWLLKNVQWKGGGLFGRA